MKNAALGGGTLLGERKLHRLFTTLVSPPSARPHHRFLCCPNHGDLGDWPRLLLWVVYRPLLVFSLLFSLSLRLVLYLFFFIFPSVWFLLLFLCLLLCSLLIIVVFSSLLRILMLSLFLVFIFLPSFSFYFLAISCYIFFFIVISFFPFRFLFFLSSFFLLLFFFLFLYSLFLSLLLSLPLLHSFHPNLSTLPYVLFAPLYKKNNHKRTKPLSSPLYKSRILFHHNIRIYRKREGI